MHVSPGLGAHQFPEMVVHKFTRCGDRFHGCKLLLVLDRCWGGIDGVAFIELSHRAR